MGTEYVALNQGLFPDHQFAFELNGSPDHSVDPEVSL